MNLTFRWYGDDDTLKLEDIKQIPCVTKIATSIQNISIGDVLSNESITSLKQNIKKSGLEFEVYESLPVPEDIKLGNENTTLLIENYCENIRRLGDAGVKCIAYNFTPVFDWLRSDVNFRTYDGSLSRVFDNNVISRLNPISQNDIFATSQNVLTKKDLRKLLLSWNGIDDSVLWQNLTRFLENVIPVAEKSGVKMAIFPDDPPWSIWGLPRIITCEKNIDKLLGLVDSPYNCITFCTGSLGADPKNDLVEMAEKYCDRIPLLHLRNIKILGDRKFEEVAHPTEYGDIDMYTIAKALVNKGWNGYVSADHGRNIWQQRTNDKLDSYDRALGTTYIAGLFEAINKEFM